MKIGIMIVDDHAIVREGLRALLANDPEIQILAEAADGHEAVQLARRLKPDVVLMDVIMQHMNGIDATRQIVKNNPKAKVIILTTMREWYKVQLCIEAGACGYIVKASPANELLHAIRNACNGSTTFSTVISKDIQDQNRRMFVSQGRIDSNMQKLTGRESEVLRLIADGFANKQIASELGISIKTVEKHRQQVMNKLNIHDIAGLTRYALSTGMVRPSDKNQGAEHTTPALPPLPETNAQPAVNAV